MGQLSSKKTAEAMGDDTLYPRAEFSAMDTDRDGLLSLTEFNKLLMFLGFGEDDIRVQIMFNSGRTCGQTHVCVEDYIEVLRNNPDVRNATSGMRVIFGSFDDSHAGTADKSLVIRRLGQMGFLLDDEMRRKCDDMDENKDGKISYEEFVRTHLRNRGYIS